MRRPERLCSVPPLLSVMQGTAPHGLGPEPQNKFKGASRIFRLAPEYIEKRQSMKAVTRAAG